MSFLIDPYALEDYFLDRILDRGNSYWASGAVVQMSQDGSGAWTATVVGSRNYRVTISPTEDDMMVCRCSCPYAADAPCKHIAAVLLELEELEIERELDFIEDDMSEEDPDLESELFEDLLKQVDREKLEEFVRSVCDADPLIYHKFIAYMTPTDSSAGKPEFRRVIESGLASAEWQGGWYDEETMEAIDPAYELLNHAEDLVKSGSWKTVLDISQAILEEMVPALEYIDDSYGEIGEAISRATELLAEVAEQPLDAELQQSFFNWCISSVRNGEHEGWDTQEELMAILVVLADGQEQVETLERFLDERMNKLGQKQAGYPWRYKLECTVSMKISLLRRENRTAEVKELMEECRHLPLVLEMLIESAWKEEDIDRVEKLAQNAIDTLGKELPGLVTGWLEWLVKVAEARGDDDMRQELLKELFYKTPNLENFRRFKSAVPQERWPEVCDEVISGLKKERYPFNILPEIYEEENRMDDLLEWLKKNPGFDTLDCFSTHFTESHPELIFAMYEQLIREYLGNNTGRNYYRDMARTLSKLSKIGFSEQVTALVKDLKEQYRNRPALQDEFRNL